MTAITFGAIAYAVLVAFAFGVLAGALACGVIVIYYALSRLIDRPDQGEPK